MRIVEQILDKMLSGDYRVQDKKVTPPPRIRIDQSMEALIHHFKIFTEGFKVPEGGLRVYESPGELGIYMVSDGSSTPYRMHVRGPCSSMSRPCRTSCATAHRRRRGHHLQRRPDHGRGAIDATSPLTTSRRRTRSSRATRARSRRSSCCCICPGARGLVTDDAMRQIAELTDTTPAEVKGTGSFYEMFKFHPVGTYMINVCTNLACQLLGGEELLAHAEEALGIKAGGTTPTACSPSKTSSASQRAPRPRACRSTIATSCGSPPTISISSSTTSATVGRPTSPSTARSAWSVSTSAGAGAGIVAPEQATEHRSGSPETTLPTKEESLMPTHDYVPHAPGYVDNDGPKIVTSRFVHEDSHTLERYEATNGYDGLRRPRPHAGRCPRRGPRRRRARPWWRRLPGGRQVGLRLPASSYYLVVNGDESEPGTYKDRLHGA